MEEPAAAGITGAAVGDVGEPDGFFWSSSEDSNDVWPVCLRGNPNDSLLEAALVLQTLCYLIVSNLRAIVKTPSYSATLIHVARNEEAHV